MVSSQTGKSAVISVGMSLNVCSGWDGAGLFCYNCLSSSSLLVSPHII